ncbi:hypothetical protein KHQ81_05900 [Mycoplasmatota bacterium]|nr:hypothetical protein KHQ81_05900 [Mycoplasmatota bacterium]
MNEKRNILSIIKNLLIWFTVYIVFSEMFSDFSVGISPSSVTEFLDYFDIAIVPLLFIILLEIKEIKKITKCQED